MKNLRNGGYPFEKELETLIKNNLEKVIENNFIFLTYKNKYNLTFNDERILRISEFDMYIDLLLMKEYEKYLKNKAKNYDEEFIEDIVDNNYTLEDLKSGKVNKIFVSGYSNEEIEEFWNNEEIYGKKFDDVLKTNY